MKKFKGGQQPFTRAVRTEERMICMPNFTKRIFEPVNHVLLLQPCLFSTKFRANGYVTLVTNTLDSNFFSKIDFS